MAPIPTNSKKALGQLELHCDVQELRIHFGRKAARKRSKGPHAYSFKQLPKLHYRPYQIDEGEDLNYSLGDADLPI